MKLLFLLTALCAALAASAAHASGTLVPFSGYQVGTIVVKTHDRELFLVESAGEALRYPVAVGRAGMRWFGKSWVNGKYIDPPWEPPPIMLHGRPTYVIPGGSPKNPMGVAALTLAGHGNRYAIHGTNEPQKIGQFVSHGCIRMFNADVTQLFKLVRVGTPVVVEK